MEVRPRWSLVLPVVMLILVGSRRNRTRTGPFPVRLGKPSIETPYRKLPDTGGTLLVYRRRRAVNWPVVARD